MLLVAGGLWPLATGLTFRAVQGCPWGLGGGQRTLIVPLLGQPRGAQAGALWGTGPPTPQQPPKQLGQSYDSPAAPHPLLHGGI